MEYLWLINAALPATSLTCGAGFWEVDGESGFGMWEEGNFEGVICVVRRSHCV
jgi:hypothetical protein